MAAYDSRDFVHNGQAFTAELHHDSDMGEPWKEHVGHGPVSDWRSSDYAKAPGEMLLATDWNGRYRRYYDFAEATRIAKRDGWGLGEEETAVLAAKLGRAPTRKEVTRESVLSDYRRLRDWCRDEWHWCGVVVTDNETGATESLWGIESDAGDYLREVAQELADSLISATV